jgi:hypothetical protein
MNPEDHRMLAIITRRNASTRHQKWIDRSRGAESIHPSK